MAENPYRYNDNDRYLSTLEREKKILTHPEVLHLKSTWGCQFQKQIKEDKDLETFLKNREPMLFATLREAFKGGIIISMCI